MAITDNLISFWELEESSGVRYDSVISSANDLSANNAPGVSIGKVGNCLHCTAASLQSVSRSDNASLRTGDIDWTICAWVYFDSIPVGAAAGTIVSKNATNGEYIFYYYNGKWTLEVFDATPNITYYAQGTMALSTARWYFTAVTVNSVSSQAKIYVDNASIVTANRAFLVPTTDATAPFYIGDDIVTAQSTFDGRIDQVGFWKRCVSESELTYLYNGGLGRSYGNISRSRFRVMG